MSLLCLSMKPGCGSTKSASADEIAGTTMKSYILEGCYKMR
jgi:hypothetical protein